MPSPPARAASALLGFVAIGMSGIGIGGASAQGTDWSRQVTRIIAAKQSYPLSAQKRGEEGTARIRVYVNASGVVEKTELLGGSGSAALDREAMALPRRAGTLPPPPGGPRSLTLPITWRLM
ncbi:energy transducer TonB family protein [Novosphingobium sp.]|uniref:energy transducer TonB family protein n=1 Tax=Novosphingobium sp. TaxID=1874826 RepID=UPI002FDE24BF